MKLVTLYSMKRNILFFAAIALLVLPLFVSCDPDDVEPADVNAPKIAWQANPRFDRVEVSTRLDSKITLEAPRGVATFTVTLSEMPTGYHLLANRIIADRSNWGESGKAPILDMINDNLVSNAIRGTGSSLKGRTTAFNIDAQDIYYAIVGDEIVPNDSRFTFVFELTDNEGKSVKRNISLHYTVGPTVTITPQRVELTANAACSVSIKAQGAIEQLILQFTTSSSALTSWLNSRAGGLSTDLVANSVFENYGLPVGKAVDGKKDLTLDLSKLLNEVRLSVMNEGTSTHVITVRVVDKNGKETSESLTVYFMAP